MTLNETQKLIIENMNFAKRIAQSSRKKFYFLSLQEIESAAYMGLVKAATKFDSTKKDFLNYAKYMIKYAILDYLRELSWGNLTMTRDCESILHDMVCREEKISNSDFFNEVAKCLKENYKGIVYLSVVEGLANREIAELKGLTEARISQIIKISFEKIFKYWKNRQEQLWELV